jgi:FSR family fosmidomycin resistance protein-like MFS transporter
VALGIAGALALASFSITVVLAQQALGRAAALASGLTLGFGVGIGGLGVGISGIVSEHFGIVPAVTGLCLLPFVGGLLALRIRPATSAAN